MNNYTFQTIKDNPIPLFTSGLQNVISSPDNDAALNQAADQLWGAYVYPFMLQTNITSTGAESFGIGIDTVHIKFPMTIPDDLLCYPWKKGTIERDDCSVKKTYRQTIYSNGVKLHMKYLPVDYQGKALLVIEISSIARLLFGNNTTPIYDMGQAILGLNEIFGELLPGLRLDIGSGILEHIDFFRDYFVGDCVDYCIEAISQTYYRGRSRDVFTNRPNRWGERANGASFKSSENESVYYSLGEKRGTYGYLRQETRLKDTNVIEKAVGRSNPTLRGNTAEIAFKLLKRDQVRLKLWGTSITGGNCAHEKLRQYYPAKVAYHLYSVLKAIHEHPYMDKKEIAAYLGIGTQQFNRLIDKIAKAGVTPGLIDREIMLPPLELAVPDGRECKKVPILPSDTEIGNSFPICGVMQ